VISFKRQDDGYNVLIDGTVIGFVKRGHSWQRRRGARRSSYRAAGWFYTSKTGTGFTHTRAGAAKALEIDDLCRLLAPEEDR
jgi:carbohydrate-selective porin OprB